MAAFQLANTAHFEPRGHFVAKDAKITVDGKASKLEDLKPGLFIRVTTKKLDDKVLAVVIETKRADSRRPHASSWHLSELTVPRGTSATVRMSAG